MIQNEKCSLTQDVISYIYNEMSADELRGFEAHLDTCLYCTEELNGISIVTKSIDRWRIDAFDSLAVTNVSAHFDKEFIEPSEDKLTSGFLQAIGSFFKFPRIAAIGVAFGSLIIGIALTATFLILNDGNNEISMTSNSPQSSVNVNAQEKIDRTNHVDGSVSPPDLSDNSAVKDQEVAIDLPTPSHRMVNTATRSTTLRKNKPNESSVSKSTTVNSPRLSNFEEYEDDTLRLSDLIDDLDDTSSS